MSIEHQFEGEPHIISRSADQQHEQQFEHQSFSYFTLSKSPLFSFVEKVALTIAAWISSLPRFFFAASSFFVAMPAANFSACVCGGESERVCVWSFFVIPKPKRLRKAPNSPVFFGDVAKPYGS
jgi:hypothetical protein